MGQEILINEDFDDGVTFWVNNWGLHMQYAFWVIDIEKLDL